MTYCLASHTKQENVEILATYPLLNHAVSVISYIDSSQVWSIK